MLYDPERIDDDVLALIFISCHPVLSREASVALTLRVLGGLTSDEIARAFVTPTATVQARITRAKKTLAAAQVPFEVPPYDERRERLSSVLSVIYLIFTEGSSATSGSEVDPYRPRPRGDPARPGPGPAGARRSRDARAARPARADRRTLPGPGPRRRDAGAAGGPGPAPWDRAAIRRGRAALVRPAGSAAGLGAYGLQASIAECHAIAPSVEATDWDRIVLLYDALRSLAPSPIVELNRAVAVSMASGPAAALPLVDALVSSGIWPRRTCCRASAASCSPASVAPKRRASSWRTPYGCAPVSGSATCSRGRSTRSTEPGSGVGPPGDLG